MRISDNEVKKVLSKQTETADVDLGDAGRVGEPEVRPEDAPLIKRITQGVVEMPDREDAIAHLRARIEAGDYNPSGEEIADAMIRRSIADRIR